MPEALDVGLLPARDLSDHDLARLLAPKLKALADETRLILVLLLADRPCMVRELQEETGLGQTLVSHHLGLLREQGLVSVTARGRSNVYTLCCEQLAEPVRVLATLAALTPQGAAACCRPPADTTQPADQRP
jgi:DNA-binding transcriptional ArsR family regulator